jgi:hypothetical protein
MSNFAAAMATTAKTWNGATSLSTPDISGQTSGRMSLFFKSVRGCNIPQLYEYLREAAAESIDDAFLLAFHIRDCRGGKGERELGRRALVWLFLNYPSQFERVAEFMAEYGRWDDLLELFPGVLNLSSLDYVRTNYCSNIEGEKDLGSLRELQRVFVNIMTSQLRKDMSDMKEGKPISICAKWAPTEKDSLDRKHNVVKTLCNSMGVKPRAYRKEFITPLRQYLNIVERYMCEKKWEKIEYSKVPSCAMKRLKKAFEKHAPETFAAWKEKLKNGKVEVKAKQLQPHELCYEIRLKRAADIVCEAQWKVLEDEVKKLGVLKDALVVVDVSGSMESWGHNIGKNTPSFTPMDVSAALGLIISNAVEGSFNNHVITFHENPSFVVLKKRNLYDRWSQLMSIPWGGNTNIQKTFELILDNAKQHKLSEDDMPKRLFIISDMQFDCNNNYLGSSATNFQDIEKQYSESGYSRPQIVFWNVNGASTDFPVSVTDNGTALISGFSPSIMKAILKGKDFSPYSVMRETLDDERYDPVKLALEIPDLVDISESDDLPELEA